MWQVEGSFRLSIQHIYVTRVMQEGQRPAQQVEGHTEALTPFWGPSCDPQGAWPHGSQVGGSGHSMESCFS